MSERLQRRDSLVAHQQGALDAAAQKCRRLHQRMEDLFGAEAAELEPPKLQYTAKQGSREANIDALRGDGSMTLAVNSS